MLWAGASGLAVGSLGQPGRTVCECVCLLMKYGKTSREPFLCVGAIICIESPLSSEYDTEILAFIEAASKHHTMFNIHQSVELVPRCGRRRRDEEREREKKRDL